MKIKVQHIVASSKFSVFAQSKTFKKYFKLFSIKLLNNGKIVL